MSKRDSKKNAVEEIEMTGVTMTEIITLKAGKAAGYHQPQADEYGDDRIAPLVPRECGLAIP